MAVIASLNVLLKANADQFSSTMKKAERTTKAAGASMTKAGMAAQSAGKAISTAFAAVGIGMGLNAIRTSTLGIIDAFESADLMSKRLGISYNSLVTLQHAAAENGSSVEVMNAALQKMTRLLGEAAYGEKSATSALDRLGLSFATLERLAPEQQFARIMESVSALPNAMQRATALQDIFGKSSSELGNLLGMSSQEMAKFMGQLQATGNLLTVEQASGMREAAEAVDELSRSWAGLTTQIVAKSAPAISSALQLLTAAMKPGETVAQIQAVNTQLGNGFLEAIQSGQPLQMVPPSQAFPAESMLAGMGPIRDQVGQAASSFVEMLGNAGQMAAAGSVIQGASGSAFSVINAALTEYSNALTVAANATGEMAQTLSTVNQFAEMSTSFGIGYRSVRNALAQEAQTQWESMNRQEIGAASAITAGSNQDRLFSLRKETRAANQNPLKKLEQAQQAAVGLLQSLVQLARDKPVEFGL